jgi:F0F1-type ATP synthase assembly protein I
MSRGLAYLGAGFTFSAVVGGMALLGHWLDQRLESAPWLLIVGALLGVGMATYELLKTVNAVEAREGRQDSKP